MRKSIETKWRRQLLLYNPYFQADAAEFRRLLQVPVSVMNPIHAMEAVEWRSKHRWDWAKRVAEHFGFDLQMRWVNAHEPTPTITSLAITLEEGARVREAERLAQLYPLRRHAERLLSAYGLDEEIRVAVEMFILTAHPSFLVVSGITPNPSLTPRYFDATVDRDAVMVFHLGPDTVKEQWVALWPEVEKLLEERYGARAKRPRKRSAFSRHLTWWQLSKQGKNPNQIADELGEPLEDQTVRDGINNIEQLMLPLYAPLPSFSFV